MCYDYIVYLMLLSAVITLGRLIKSQDGIVLFYNVCCDIMAKYIYQWHNNLLDKWTLHY